MVYQHVYLAPKCHFWLQKLHRSILVPYWYLSKFWGPYIYITSNTSVGFAKKEFVGSVKICPSWCWKRLKHVAALSFTVCSWGIQRSIRFPVAFSAGCGIKQQWTGGANPHVSPNSTWNYRGVEGQLPQSMASVQELCWFQWVYRHAWHITKSCSGWSLGMAICVYISLHSYIHIYLYTYI